jgi:hypothetical protein
MLAEFEKRDANIGTQPRMSPAALEVACIS